MCGESRKHGFEWEYQGAIPGSTPNDDIYGTCEKIKSLGGKVTREPGPMKHGTTVIAFVEDPDGYKIELIQLSTQSLAQEEQVASV